MPLRRCASRVRGLACKRRMSGHTSGGGAAPHDAKECLRPTAHNRPPKRDCTQPTAWRASATRAVRHPLACFAVTNKRPKPCAFRDILLLATPPGPVPLPAFHHQEGVGAHFFGTMQRKVECRA
eukprot:jgi/Mesvir1/2139/Mv25642-RA.1